jgi:peroxiredoxin Q/BCP
VLYFYPKDDTSGCTTQACGFRDELPRIDAKGATVFGVSPDPISSHVKFKKKFDLNFPLLADVDHSVAEAYGVWQQKSMYGRKYMGIERSTFLIDEGGRIQEAWRKVKPAEDPGQVLSALEAMGR